MTIDPNREISITLPFGMIRKLQQVKPILSMFRDEEDVRSVIEIIDAIYAGALEYIREEEGELMEYLTSGDDDDLIPPDSDDEDQDKSDN